VEHNSLLLRNHARFGKRRCSALLCSALQLRPATFRDYSARFLTGQPQFRLSLSFKINRTENTWRTLVQSPLVFQREGSGMKTVSFISFTFSLFKNALSKSDCKQMKPQHTHIEHILQECGKMKLRCKNCDEIRKLRGQQRFPLWFTL
jgi:hypothetical protein